MGRNQHPKGGGYAGDKGSKTYASGGRGGGNKKTVDAPTALGLGLPPQNTMLSGMAGLGMVQQNPLCSLFGSMGTNTMIGLGGFGTVELAYNLQTVGMISCNLRPFWGAHSNKM